MTCELKSPLFCYLTDEELAEVNDNKLSIVFRKGETIRKQGTYMSHVLSINQGMAKMYLEGADNRNAIIRIVKATNFIGGPGIYLDQLHHYTVSALTDVSVCFIDVRLFKKLIEQNKLFAEQFMKDFSRNILAVYNRLVFLTQKQMPGRMADTLLYLSDDIYESHIIPMHLTKQDLADLSGMSKDSALKTLRDFQNEALIKYSEAQLELLDVDGLRKVSRVG